jgi:branched-chain amino acid transport system substrate-binding protein
MKAIATVLLAASLGMGSAQAQTEVKVGMVAPFSGPFASYGEQFQRGAEIYLEEVKHQAGSATVSLVARDEAGGPEKSRQVSQELIVRDKVKILMGFQLTPDAAAVAPLITQAKIPTLILNAAASSLTRRSPYFARFSFTEWQNAGVIARYAAKSGARKIAIAAADYGPGNDSRDAFTAAFKAAGGEIDSVVMMSMTTTDFAPFVQKLKDSKPDAIYLFMPVGPPAVSFIKTYYQLGLPAAGIKLFATGQTDEQDLPAIGEQALGLVTTYPYSPYIDNPANKKFVAAYKKKYGADTVPNFAAAHGYDGMHAAMDAIAKTAPEVDGDKVMAILKGWKADSPRGPITIDPVERDIIQNIYIRRVQMVGKVMGNVPFDLEKDVKDPWKEANKDVAK